VVSLLEGIRDVKKHWFLPFFERNCKKLNNLTTNVFLSLCGEYRVFEGLHRNTELYKERNLIKLGVL